MQNKVILAVIYVALSLLSVKAFAECEGKLHYLSEFDGSKIYTANTGNAIFDIIYLEENYDQSIEAMKTLKNRYSVVEDSRNRAVIIDFKNNKWIWCVAAATISGAISGLYDKHIMKALSPMFVQSWFSVYQLLMMSVIVAIMWLPRRSVEHFHWSWAIPLISIFVSCADMCYYNALNDADSMIAVVSMIRRSSVVVTFACGALLFGERNLKSKALDLALILIGMVLLCIGSV